MHFKRCFASMSLVTAGGLLAGGLLAGGLLVTLLVRGRQEKALAALWLELAQSPRGGTFSPTMVASLPEPAQRYFRHAIAPGTPLAGSVRLTMHGAIRLQPDADPVPMHAEQILAPPHGLVWKARVGRGLMRIQGFDRFGHGKGELRWWLYGLVPVVSARGPDVDRSAAGRVAGEGVLVPSTLLPQHGAVWEHVDDETAQVTLRVDVEPVTFTITVDRDGRLQRVRIRRWRGDGTPGYDSFDVDGFSHERSFGGYTIPTHFRAGWQLGEPGENPFFYAVIDEASYR